MSVAEQGGVHEFSCAGVEDWFLSLGSFGVALAAAWHGLAKQLSGKAGIQDIEQGFRRLSRHLMRVLLDLAVEALKQRDARLARPACLHCLRPMWCNRKERLTLQFLEGEIELLRNYCECRQCGLYCFPLDVDLGIAESGECTPLFGRDLCFLAIQLPAEASVRLLSALTGRQVSRTLLQQHVERDGDALLELERKEAETLWPFDEKGRWRAVESSGIPALHSAPKPAGVLVVEMDGVFANLGQESQIRDEVRHFYDEKERAQKLGQPFELERPSVFREVRQARFYRLLDRVSKPTRNGKKRCRILQSETVSVVNDPAYFPRRVNAVAHAWQRERYEAVAVLGDGGDFIWEMASTILAAQIEILDIQHAKSHIHECAKALFGEKSAQASGWARRWCDAIYDKGPDDLLAELHRLQEKKRVGEARRILDNLEAYVRKHRLRMDYPRFRALGLPIASGAIESANRQVVGDRCKRSGMSWSKPGLQRILSLLAAYLSGNWARVFDAIQQHRSCARQGVLGDSVPQVGIGAKPRQVRLLTTIEHASELKGPCPAREIATPTPRPRRPLVSNRKLNRLIRDGLVDLTADGLTPTSGH